MDGTSVEPELEWIARATGARAARRVGRIQALWGGWGELHRIALDDGPAPSVVVKRAAPPSSARLGSIGDDRKRRSYEVELAFYERFAARSRARVPKLWASAHDSQAVTLVLEDLDGSGFGVRHETPPRAERDRCLAWLAAFHASFLGIAPDGLWDEGTYFHLATRPDELLAIEDRVLRDRAPSIDALLRQCRFRTLVHGDAKEANFCFRADGAAVAAVDFQYVGGGTGMRDVAYFLTGLEAGEEARALDVYFDHLRAELGAAPQKDAVEAEWRALYPIAWVDFQRFLAGWAPTHPLRARRTRERIREILDRPFVVA